MFRINSAMPELILTQLGANDRLLARTIERLSTGLRINRGADDPAGLTASVRLRASITGLEQAGRNAETAINLTQTVDSAYSSLGDITDRLKELAIQAADSSTSSSSRSAIQEEAGQLLTEFDRIANATSFNGQSLLAATQTFTFYVGEGSGGTTDQISLQLVSSTSSQFIGGVTSANIASGADVNVISSLDLGVTSVSLQRSRVGAVQNRLEVSLTDISSRSLMLQTADSVIRDSDFARESSNLLRARILSQSQIATFVQTNLIRQTTFPLLSLSRAQ